MSRYIDAEQLWKYAENQKDKSVSANDFMRFPYIDIVRCKECKWHDTCCRNIFEDWRDATPTDIEYCSHGERQTESGLLTCKGCKYAEPYKDGMKKCTLNGQIMSDNGFCTERRE